MLHSQLSWLPDRQGACRQRHLHIVLTWLHAQHVPQMCIECLVQPSLLCWGNICNHNVNKKKQSSYQICAGRLYHIFWASKKICCSMQMLSNKLFRHDQKYMDWQVESWNTQIKHCQARCWTTHRSQVYLLRNAGWNISPKPRRRYGRVNVAQKTENLRMKGKH